jgi:hypothetical protein
MAEMRVTIRFAGERLCGNTPLQEGSGGPWRLVPTYKTRCGWRYDWDTARGSYPTKKAALADRKTLRAAGELWP